MANTTFSPKIFSKELLRKFDQKNVFMEYANRDYTWELKKHWDSVHVQIAPDLTFTASAISNAWAADFKTGTGPGWVITAEDFVITAENLIINKYTEKRIQISNFEMVQSNIDLESMIADRAAVWLKNLMDNEFRDQVLVTDIANIPAENKLYSGAPKSDVSKTTIYGYIEEMRVALENQNVTENLVLFLSPLFGSYLIQSGLLDASDVWLEDRKRGFIGLLGWVAVKTTPSLTASWEMIMMQDKTVNFVTQIVDTDVVKATDGLYWNLMFQVVWGGKIFTPSGKWISVFYTSQGTES